MVELEKLRWVVGEQDVTCENCHGALYRPATDETLCPVCRYALGEDLMDIHADLQLKATA